jgi:hypothetical protein
VVLLQKRWLLDTHPEAMSAKHRDYCLDEFASGSTGAGREVAESCSSDLSSKPVAVEPTTYRSIVEPAKAGLSETTIGSTGVRWIFSRI